MPLKDKRKTPRVTIVLSLIKDFINEFKSIYNLFNWNNVFIKKGNTKWTESQ